MIPKISIIVPIYNVERYINRCVDSILSQTFTDFECILVDDGSPDNCPMICDGYAEKDERIRVIHQNNVGTAHARDAGVKMSIGEFLVFVDSDDSIPPNAIQCLYEKQQETGADVVTGATLWHFKKHKKICKDEFNFTIPLMLPLCTTNKGLCARIYKRNLYHDEIYIPMLNYGEDLIVCIQLLLRVRTEKLSFTDSIVYIYDRRTEGITTRPVTIETIITWKEYLSNRPSLWIHSFLENENLFSGCVKDVFLLNVIRNDILTYIRAKIKINKNEINVFYNEYYCSCTIKNKIRFPERIIIPLYKFSVILGCCYVYLFNFLCSVRLKLKGMY
jgi:glycosyltransferase involved in cell wall biosynthesis